MGFKKPDLSDARQAIQTCLIEIHSPYNDGWTSRSCKHELFLLKYWLEQQYRQLPEFAGEQEWEKEIVWDQLSQHQK